MGRSEVSNVCRHMPFAYFLVAFAALLPFFAAGFFSDLLSVAPDSSFLALTFFAFPAPADFADSAAGFVAVGSLGKALPSTSWEGASAETGAASGG